MLFGPFDFLLPKRLCSLLNIPMLFYDDLIGEVLEMLVQRLFQSDHCAFELVERRPVRVFGVHQMLDVRLKMLCADLTSILKLTQLVHE